MVTYSTLTCFLALAGSSMAGLSKIESRQIIVNDFSLRAYSSKIQDWAVISTTAPSGQTIVEIQRPTAFQSTPVYLNSTSKQAQVEGRSKLVFDIEGSDPLEVVLPDVAAGQAGEVVTLSSGGSEAFSVNGEALLSVRGAGADGFYACPQDIGGTTNFVLWYGVDVPDADLPNVDCQAIELRSSS